MSAITCSAAPPRSAEAAFKRECVPVDTWRMIASRLLLSGALLAGLLASFTGAGTAAAHRPAALPGDGRVRISGVSIRVTKDTQIDDTLTDVHVTEHQAGAFVLAAGGSRTQRNGVLFTAPITGGLDTSVHYTPPEDQGAPSTCRYHDEPNGQLQVLLRQEGGHYRATIVPALDGAAHECGQFDSRPEALIGDVDVPASLVARNRFSITAHGTMRVAVTESVHEWTARITFVRVA